MLALMRADSNTRGGFGCTAMSLIACARPMDVMMLIGCVSKCSICDDINVTLAVRWALLRYRLAPRVCQWLCLFEFGLCCLSYCGCMLLMLSAAWLGLHQAKIVLL